MPTAKRQRQKEGRRARLEAVRKVQQRRRLLRRAAWVVVIAGVVLGTVFAFMPGSKAPAPTSAQQKANALAVKAGCPANPLAPVHPTLRWHRPPPTVIDVHKTYSATVTTTAGTFAFTLQTKGAPVNVNNFVFLADHGFYTCTTFWRVVKSFMDQTGDPTQTGQGGPGYYVPKNEFPPLQKNGVQYPAGVVAMAHRSCSTTPAKCPATNGSQFFVEAYPEPSSAVPPEYTIIGVLTSGLKVVEHINAEGTPTAQGVPNVYERVLSVKIHVS